MKKATFVNSGYSQVYTCTQDDNGAVSWSDGKRHGISMGNGSPHISISGLREDGKPVTFTAISEDKQTALELMLAINEKSTGAVGEKKPRTKKATAVDYNVYKLAEASEKRVAFILFCAVGKTVENLTAHGATAEQVNGAAATLAKMLTDCAYAESIEQAYEKELQEMRETEQKEKEEAYIAEVMRKMDCDRDCAIAIINAKNAYKQKAETTEA